MTIRTSDLIKNLQRAGFIFSRCVGSHRRFIHPDGRSTTIAAMDHESLGRKLVVKIARQVKIEVKELMQ